MGNVKDFGRDPLPGSGTWEVREPGQGKTRGRLLGTVTASTVDEARAKAQNGPGAGTAFVVTEIPLGKE